MRVELGLRALCAAFLVCCLSEQLVLGWALRVELGGTPDPVVRQSQGRSLEEARASRRGVP